MGPFNAHRRAFERSCLARWFGDIAATRTTLLELKEVGVKIAIDDLGTGYAGLSRLTWLPVDMLKIGTGCVRDLGASAGELSRPVPGDATEASPSPRWMPMPFLADREATTVRAI